MDKFTVNIGGKEFGFYTQKIWPAHGPSQLAIFSDNTGRPFCKWDNRHVASAPYSADNSHIVYAAKESVKAMVAKHGEANVIAKLQVADR